MAAVGEEATDKVIAVFGGTGSQGGSVAAALLSAGKYKVRVVTRSPDGAKAKAIAEAGAEVVKADAEDKDSLAKALDGCYGAYVVTSYWTLMSADKEIAHGTAIADACKAAGLKHVIFSTLFDTRKCNKDGKLVGAPFEPLQKNTSNENGDFIVPHFDAKADIEEYMRRIELPCSFVRFGCYLDNFLMSMQPQKQEDGSYVIAMPTGDTKLAWVAVEDCGPAIASIFDDASKIGGTFDLANEKLAAADVASILSEVTGKKINFYPVSREGYEAFGFPGADDLARMFAAVFAAGPPAYVCDLEHMKALNPKKQTVKEWAGSHKDALLAVLA